MTAPTITDSQVEVALAAYESVPLDTVQRHYPKGSICWTFMRAALEAAERAAWRPIEEAPEGVPCEFVFAEDRNERVSGVREGGQVRVRSVVFGLSLLSHFRPLPPPPEGDGK